MLNDRANDRQCAAYINRVNLEQAGAMNKMISELKQAFSLTIPDNRLERKLKTTPAYVGVYDNIGCVFALQWYNMACTKVCLSIPIKSNTL